MFTTPNDAAEYAKILVDLKIATPGEIEVATYVADYSFYTLDQILMCRTGYSSLNQYLNDKGQTIDDIESKEDA